MPRPQPASNPALANALLAAVAHRHTELATHLGRQWVHRRGLEDLETFVDKELKAAEGENAVAWFLTRLGLQDESATEPGRPLEKSSSERVIPVTTQRSSALFTRMKTLFRQRLEEAILGLEHEDRATPISQPATAPQLAPLPQLNTRLRAVPPNSPAPVPQALADLRAWLPEDHADLPRAS